MKRLVVCSIIFLFLSVCINSVFASGEAGSSSGVLEIKIGHNGPPSEEDNAAYLFIKNFERLLKEKTGGQIQLVIYSDSQLGTEEEVIEQMMSDHIMNLSSYAGIGTIFPELYAGVIPFLFENYDAGRWFFTESDFWEQSQTMFRDRTGMVLLECVEEGGFTAFTNSTKPIHGPDDFKGMKFRAMDESQVALFNAFGASGIPIPWSELYTALQTGVATGQMNPPMYIIIGSLYEIQKYLSVANIQYSMQWLVMNGELFDSLNQAQQTMVREAAREAAEITRRDVESRVNERLQFLADQGMDIYYPTVAEMDAFREIGQPSFIQWLGKRFDRSWIDLALSSAKEANSKY